MVGIFTSFTNFVDASRTIVNVTGCFFRNPSMSSFFLSTFTATITSPLSPYFCLSSSIAGNDSLHGSHHEAKKSTSTILPRRSGREPSRPNCARSGNGSPSLGVAASAAPPNNSASAKAKREGVDHLLCIDEMFMESRGDKVCGFSEDSARGAERAVNQVEPFLRPENERAG